MTESIINIKIVKNIIERRNREIHKGDCGRILICAGSLGMAGAAVLCARGALRSGAGLVQLSVPREIFPIVQTGVPEATCLVTSLSKTDLSRYDAAAIGPGLGDSEESVNKVKDLLKFYDGPLVVDADGLNILAKENLWDMMKVRGKAGSNSSASATGITGSAVETGSIGNTGSADSTQRAGNAGNANNTASSASAQNTGSIGSAISAQNAGPAGSAQNAGPAGTVSAQNAASTDNAGTAAKTIITPHIGEARRIMGGDYSDKMSRRELAIALAEKTGAITVLKGAGTIVATTDQKTYTNTTGNPGMATAGSGDVLTGIITSLCGQKKPSGQRITPLEAAIAGVYIHGMAGDLGALDKGEYGLTAGDIAEYTALALRKISEES